jgi:hypothetical protein
MHRRLGVLTLVVLLLAGLAGGPALAVGTWSYWQQTYDWSSSFQARGVSRCSAGCASLLVGIKWSGQWTESECSGSCYQEESPWKTFAFPSGVETHHSYCDGSPYPWCAHGADDFLYVYYP